MKIYAVDYNNVLSGIIDELKKREMFTDDYHQADLFLLWQDLRGECKELASIASNHLKKPVFVMQHGRGAVRDYGPPNSFPLQADRVLVWGPTEKKRLLSYGIPEDRILVTGCPLFPRLKPKVKREGKNVVFCPVIAQKEEPENILVYGHLKKWESEKLIENIYENFAKMKRAWGYEENQIKPVKLFNGEVEERLWKKEYKPNLPRNITYAKGFLNVKLTPVHDAFQYESPIIITGQNQDDHIDSTIELLRNTDVLVCLEEGTMQLLASMLDIPVIVADIFKYEDYGGTKDYDRVEKINTPSVYRTNKLEKLGRLVDHALAHPEELRKQRIAVCEAEGGANLGNGVENAISAIERFGRVIDLRKCIGTAK